MEISKLLIYAALTIGLFGCTRKSEIENLEARIRDLEIQIKEHMVLSAPIASSDKISVIADYLKKYRFDGLNTFFTENRTELIENIELVNFFSIDNMGIAFVRTNASGKKINFSLWMRRYEDKWEGFEYLNQYYRLHSTWVASNEDWYEDMLDKISKWDEESDAIWLSSNNNALQKTLADNRAIMNNLRQICTAAQMFFLESGEPIAKYSDLIGEYLSKPKPINGENYTDIIIKSDDTSVQVIDADGVLHKYQF